jgi:hypothetical protein
MRKNSGLTRTLIASLLLLLPAVAGGRDRPFDAIVQRIESYYHKRPVRFMGLASFLASRARPEGVRDM